MIKKRKALEGLTIKIWLPLIYLCALSFTITMNRMGDKLEDNCYL